MPAISAPVESALEMKGWTPEALARLSVQVARRPVPTEQPRPGGTIAIPAGELATPKTQPHSAPVYRLEVRRIGESRWESACQETSVETFAQEMLDDARAGRGICAPIVTPAKYSTHIHEFRVREICTNGKAD